jgi:flavin reductase (DIM6/NTAB) family NADH-FMN oxidoreductase RutF
MPEPGAGSGSICFREGNGEGVDGDIKVEGELPVDSSALQQFTAGLDYSMLIVTTRHEDIRAGCLIGFSTQTSIDPWRMLVCLSRKNTTTRVAAQAGVIAVHRLGREQLGLARLFGEESGEWTDKFARCAWRDGPRGMPVLAECPAWFVGEIVSIDDVGDHAGVLVAAVAAGGSGTGDPLTFSAVTDLEPGQEA